METWEIAVGVVLVIVAIAAGLFVVTILSAVPAAELVALEGAAELSGIISGSAA